MDKYKALYFAMVIIVNIIIIWGIKNEKKYMYYSYDIGNI